MLGRISHILGIGAPLGRVPRSLIWICAVHIFFVLLQSMYFPKTKKKSTSLAGKEVTSSTTVFICNLRYQSKNQVALYFSPVFSTVIHPLEFICISQVLFVLPQGIRSNTIDRVAPMIDEGPTMRVILDLAFIYG